MQTLAHQIAMAAAAVCAAEYEVKVKQEELRLLIAKRGECQHKFSTPWKGYEHEGGVCTECGIGELYASAHKIGKM